MIAGRSSVELWFAGFLNSIKAVAFAANLAVTMMHALKVLLRAWVGTVFCSVETFRVPVTPCVYYSGCCCVAFPGGLVAFVLYHLVGALGCWSVAPLTTSPTLVAQVRTYFVLSVFFGTLTHPRHCTWSLFSGSFHAPLRVYFPVLAPRAQESTISSADHHKPRRNPK